MRALLVACAGLTAVSASAAPQRCAEIADATVVNVVIADPATALPNLDCSNPAAQIGWSFVGGVYARPAASAPAYPTSGLTFLQFLGLFSPAEQAAIVSSPDAQVRLFVVMAGGAESLDLANPQVVAGVNYLAAQKIIAAARVTAILSGAPPA